MEKRLQVYQVTLIFSLLFTLFGFSYNVWRLQQTESNSNIRTACFEMLSSLSVLEQLVYSAHYDGDPVAGNPRSGWVKVGLIRDLSVLTSLAVSTQAEQLHRTWSDNWSLMPAQRDAADRIVEAIDKNRNEIKQLLISLH